MHNPEMKDHAFMPSGCQPSKTCDICGGPFGAHLFDVMKWLKTRIYESGLNHDEKVEILKTIKDELKKP